MLRTLLFGLIVVALTWPVTALGQAEDETAVVAATPEADSEGDAEPGADAEDAEKEAEDAEKEVDDRTSFDVKLGDQGRARGRAGVFDYQDGAYLIATNGVEIVYRDLKVVAERVRVDLPNNLLTAEGDIVFDEGPRRLSGDTLEYDLNTRTGRLTNAKAFVEPDYYFSGDEISKVGPDDYAINDGIFTACTGDVPAWSIHLSDAKVTIGEYARIKNARLKLKRVPIFYAPYMVWPARTDRTSGFLMPKPGYSRRRGAYLGMAYFKTLGRSADMTFQTDLYSKGFYGFGAEARYRPSEKSTGRLEAYIIREPDDLDYADFQPILDPERLDAILAGVNPDLTRWKFRYSHETTDIWGGFRGVIAIEEFSDFDFQRDYERNVSLTTRPYIYSNAYLSRSFGQHSLNLLIDRTEGIARNTPKDLRHRLPAIDYRLRPTAIGNTQFYFSLESSVNYFSIDNGLEDGKLDYGRADFAPTLSIPLSSLPWLSAKLDLGARGTFYTKSLEDPLNPDTTDNDNLDGGLSRFLPSVGLEVIGPSFSRIFETQGKGRFGKFKHIIEPRLVYGFVDEFDDQNRVLVFDNRIDRLRSGNGFVFSLTNRLLAKPSNEEEGGATEIASLEIAQGYSFDDDQPGQIDRDGGQIVRSTNEGPLLVALRIDPSENMLFKTDITYNTLFNDLQSFALTAGAKLGRHSVGATWRTRWNLDLPEGTDQTTTDQAQLFTTFQLVPDTLSFDAAVTYDLRLSELLSQHYFLRWTRPCYSLDFELRESRLRGAVLNPDADSDLDFRFSFTLKHVGTFLELTGGLGSSGSN